MGQVFKLPTSSKFKSKRDLLENLFLQVQLMVGHLQYSYFVPQVLCNSAVLFFQLDPG